MNTFIIVLIIDSCIIVIATGGWSEQDNEHYKYLQSLLEHYRSVAQQEKLDRERKRFSHRKSAYLTLTDKYGLPSLLGRKSLAPLSPYAPKVGLY